LGILKGVDIVADWQINAIENDGYPSLVELGDPPIFNFNTLFTEPKPRNIWVINPNANDGYPFISWQFDFDIPVYSRNRPYYRSTKKTSTQGFPTLRWLTTKGW
jgi:hypothetical protein